MKESQFTVAERHEIYKGALSIYILGNRNYLCLILEDLTEGIFEYNKAYPLFPNIYLESNFPELYKQKPAMIANNGGGWWDKGDRESRIQVLQNCINQTKP